jgi:hypothetical protein
MTSIRSGLLTLLICSLPATANAGCGPFSPCGTPGWIGFSLALPVPRLPHLHTFGHRGCQSPLCGAGPFVGSGAFGGCGLGCGHGGCATGCNPCAPAIGPTYSPPVLTPQPTFPETSFHPCAPLISQTQLVPQQTISYREVPQVQYRQEAYTQMVPVTTYQQQTRLRTVPYQTVARIPQISTQYIPQMTATAGCDPCLAGVATMPYSAGSLSAMPVLPAQTRFHDAGGVPEYPYPAMTPQVGASEWQTIPQRQAATPTEVEQMGYQQSYSPSIQRQATQSLFRPAPSATAAWQSRFLR